MGSRAPKKKIVIQKSPKDKEVLQALFKDEHCPSWEDYDKMRGFLSSRGRILARTLTGITAKQQRQLTAAIKQARHLALLPFVTSI